MSVHIAIYINMGLITIYMGINIKYMSSDSKARTCVNWGISARTFPSPPTRLIGGGVSELPRCFKELAGKQCLFQIRVTPYNFTPHYRTFTVDEYVDVKTHSGGESNNRAPQVVSQSEQPPASASDPVDAATKVMAVDQPTPPSFGVQVGNATLSESWKCSKL
ncbi:unnamed protein product [Brassica oleracea]